MTSVMQSPIPVTAAESKAAAIQIGKAKAALVLERPFVAAIAMNLNWAEDNTIPTLATNGKQLLYNAKFVNGLTFGVSKSAVAHEVWHCVLQHMFRRGSRNHRRFNQAGDYIINGILADDGFELGEGWLHDASLVAAGGGTTDGVYDLLPEDQEGDDPLDDCQDAEGSPATQATAEAEMKVQIAQAAQAAKMQGKLSAHEARIAALAVQPKVVWEDVLQRFVSAKAKTEYSYARPKRRTLDPDIISPSLSGMKLGQMVVAVDCSGSIDSATLGEFAREIKAIHQDCQPERTHVIYFDSEVSHTDHFDTDEEIQIEMHGGGGTAFSPIFKGLEAQGIDPACVVVLTDLCCSDFGSEPGYPVLWVSTDPGTAPWGEVVLMNPKR